MKILDYIPYRSAKLEIMNNVIDKFDGEYSFLSNFWEETFMCNGVIYPTVEHYFQSEKTNNQDEKIKILTAPTPGKAKRLGRKITLRSDWERVKYGVMQWGVYSKFAQNDYLRKKLMKTKNKILIEGNNWHDNYWGDCVCDKCANISAENKLGQILMRVRDLCL